MIGEHRVEIRTLAHCLYLQVTLNGPASDAYHTRPRLIDGVSTVRVRAEPSPPTPPASWPSPKNGVQLWLPHSGYNSHIKSGGFAGETAGVNPFQVIDSAYLPKRQDALGDP